MDDGHYTYGPEVDLDHEEVRDSHGNRVTPEYVEKALADVLDENSPVRPAEVSTHPGRHHWPAGAHTPRR